MVVHHAVGDVLNDRRSLLVVNQLRCLEDKLLRIVFELVERSLINAGEDLNDSLPGKLGGFNDSSNKVICDALAGDYGLLGANRKRRIPDKRRARPQLLLGLYFNHRAGFDFEVDLRHAQLAVECCDRFADKLVRIEIHHVDGLCVDPRPECFELLAIKLLFVDLQFHIVAASILRRHCLRIVNRIDDVHDGGFKTFDLLGGHLELAVCLVLVVLVCEDPFAVNIAVHGHFVHDCRRRIGIDNHLVAVIVRDNMVQEQVPRNSTRTVCDILGNLGLESLGEALVTFRRNYGQHVDVLHIVSENSRVHAFAVLVDGKTHASPDFLPLANLA